MSFCRWRVIEEVQAALKGTAAEGCVSTADLIVLAGAYAVSMTGGPLVDVGIGAAAVMPNQKRLFSTGIVILIVAFICDFEVRLCNLIMNSRE